jgi:hypothetical protein
VKFNTSKYMATEERYELLMPMIAIMIRKKKKMQVKSQQDPHN